MTYPQAIEFLHRLNWFGSNLGLARTLRLADMLGNPHQRLRFIHVAGTNGKGSTCAMLESIYRTSGLRVGLFTSPHLVAFAERIQVNRRLIPEADIARLTEQVATLVEREWGKMGIGSPDHPTFFEVVTIIALLYFAEQQCDLVIWETGLGGRLDATNIVTPLASVITNVQWDHQNWLGDSLAKIAAEKAGIIKPGVPAITATDEPEALEIIQARAIELNSALTIVSPATADEPPLDEIRLPLPGRHQRINAALAVATVRVLAKRTLPITEDIILTGLKTVNWPGRLQLITRPNGQRLLLDGAHNLAGTLALVSSIGELFPGDRPTFVLGILQDKNWSDMCRQLAPVARRVLLVPVNSSRSADPSALASACAEANPSAGVEICGSMVDALRRVESDTLVVVTGSLYLIGEVLEQLGENSAPSIGERKLNEWTARA